MKTKKLYLMAIEQGYDHKSVLLFCRDDSGKKFDLICTNFVPYFYVEKGVPIPDRREIVSVEEIPYKVKHTLFKEELVKVYLNSTKSVPPIRDGFHNNGYKTYEADILYPLRFKCDLGILEGLLIPVEVLERKPLTAHGRPYEKVKGKWWVKPFIPVRKEEIRGF